MVVYYSIFAFTCFFAFLGCILQNQKYVKSSNKGRDIEESIKNEKSISLFFALVSFSLLVYFVGMRTAFIDTYAYIMMFNGSSTDLSELKVLYENDVKGIGFQAMMIFFKKYISSDVNAWFMFLAIFQAGAVVKIYYKYSVNFFMSAYLFIASTTFTWMMNGIRQFTAVCLILYFLDWAFEKKTIKFIMIILLAYTIHDSAIFWIPVYFIMHFKPYSKKIWICVILTLVLVFGIDQFTDLLDASTEGTEYEGLGTEITHYGNDDGVSLIRVAVAAVPAAIALLRRKIVLEKSNHIIDCLINMSVVAVGVYLVGVVTSGILVGRIPIYFTVTNFILLPWLLNNTFDGKVRTIIKAICYVLYFAYFYYGMVMVKGFSIYESAPLGIYYK